MCIKKKKKINALTIATPGWNYHNRYQFSLRLFLNKALWYSSLGFKNQDIRSLRNIRWSVVEFFFFFLMSVDVDWEEYTWDSEKIVARESSRKFFFYYRCDKWENSKGSNKSICTGFMVVTREMETFCACWCFGDADRKLPSDLIVYCPLYIHWCTTVRSR